MLLKVLLLVRAHSVIAVVGGRVVRALGGGSCLLIGCGMGWSYAMSMCGGAPRWVWLGFGFLSVLLVPGLGGADRRIALFFFVIGRIDVIVHRVVLAGLSVVVGAEALVAVCMELLC